ncbi:MAG: peptide/nickel transport system ATP-binding protein [Thermoanaerobacteraceae bacterium]|jgi:oligopeptide/dipeptide ABC transporter ATP-binding protein|uniref:ATP-binding cassette domain-containing protein n=1 Tax=Biomaibacter acetigenes TaxID=2316383 RepID=A0A3G2R6Q0_9FIRM|nr:ABC transporter ATP-binding protein [Biomaibacter acetigenes]AYO31045.1 ATP-binding cassette domain-containing protein [Biomaibacter acetigenes]MDK2877343.1 peptide/nickel transport system ATP-binding protein [Thermoanaerobacteraceae bacterium]MDN5311946.1 peptide/nickel transport system ATP-binding protein [Thermoanaerobacteraceae bacterium]RKL63877.1 ABC transporter ATP-binding protein [Thermoanaerobacteraceae bacterium SP2]
MNDNLVEVKNLKTYFFTDDGVVPAVDGVDFSIKKGETLGIVGESGCGKSVTSLSLLRLVPNPPGKIVDGEMYFKGENLLEKSESEMRKIRGNDISMIFQEPMTSLNPVFTVGEQISEAIELHQGLNKRDALAKAVEMLKLVGIPSAEQRVNEYPHQMSGGMRQRVMIAMALSCNPALLIADEPTTALDVTIQAQILELMKDLKERLGTAIMLITHDLGVVAEMAENVLVMYAGKVVEYADVKTIFKNPKHPYTVGLLGSIPRLDQPKEKLYVIEGVVPNPFNMPSGCRFHPRCPEAREICKTKEPELLHIDGQQVRCWKYTDEWKGGGR